MIKNYYTQGQEISNSYEYGLPSGPHHHPALPLPHSVIPPSFQGRPWISGGPPTSREEIIEVILKIHFTICSRNYTVDYVLSSEFAFLKVEASMILYPVNKACTGLIFKKCVNETCYYKFHRKPKYPESSNIYLIFLYMRK